MFALSSTSLAIRSALAGALLASLALAAPAQAQTVAINEITARGDSLLNGVASDALADTSSGPASFVDVSRFSFDIGSGVGLHSYGSSNGVFGSRSSGFGLFDVTGSLFLKLTITNDQSTAQNAVFDFHITPGLLELTDLPYTGSQFAETGIGFQILTSNGKSFSSAAVLRSDAAGLAFSSSGDTSLYGGSGANRFVIGADRTLDLGVLGAGESVTLSYTLSSYAKGDTALAQTTVVPGRTVLIPGYWSSGCSEEIPQLGVEAAVDEVPQVQACTGEPVFVQPQEVTLPDTTYNEGDAGSALASSGDPFALNLQAGQLVLPPNRNGQPFNVSFTAAGTTTNVPEPGALPLALLALVAAGVATRRRAH